LTCSEKGKGHGGEKKKQRKEGGPTLRPAFHRLEGAKEEGEKKKKELKKSETGPSITSIPRLKERGLWYSIIPNAAPPTEPQVMQTQKKMREDELGRTGGKEKAANYSGMAIATLEEKKN